MKVTFARNLRELDELSLAWRRLESQVANVLPFQTYAWTRAWWQIFKVDNLVRCDELMVTAYWDDDLLVGVIPRIVTRYRVAGINFYHYVRPIGADPNLTEIRVPLILPYFQEEVVDCWLDTVEHFRDPRGLHKIIAPLQVLNPTEPDMFEQSMMDTLQTMTSSIRSLVYWTLANLQFCGRYCRQLGSLPQGIEAQYQGVAPPLPIRLPKMVSRPSWWCIRHRRRSCPAGPLLRTAWRACKRQGTVAHPDYFAKSQHRRFLNLLADSATALGMRLFCLVINGQPVAMRLGFVVNTELYMYYSGYRQDHAKYSVMTTLVQRK
ncbi:MAG: GNAT family N-acetyltransferase [Betaproteobacteria bacterium]|nr:GNAT family N-acetyltransferase [Betaproteobacteria bacterium]